VAQEMHAQLIRNRIIQLEERKRLYAWFSFTHITLGIVWGMLGLVFLTFGFKYFMYSVYYLGPGLVYLILGLVLLRFSRRLLNSFSRNTLE
jgi:hypothetical protein